MSEQRGRLSRRSSSRASFPRQSEDRTTNWTNQARRHANVFDSVAGRVHTNGFIKDRRYGQDESILAPDEVLFKSKHAPERTQEDDFYWADRNLQSDALLPESDLLKVLHIYAADYYDGTTPDHGQSDLKSLDGSALLALGILLEETVFNILGDLGDMAFVEGLLVDHESPTGYLKKDPDTNTIRATSRTRHLGSKSFKAAKRRR